MAADEVVSLLCFDADEARGVLRFWLRLRWLFAVLAVFALVQFMHDAVAHLQLAQQTGQWDTDYWSYFLTLSGDALWCVITLMLVFIFPATHLTASQLAGGVAALRVAVASRDARVVQPAAQFTARLETETESIPHIPASFGPFKQPTDSLAQFDGVTGGFFLLMGLTLCVGSVAVTLPRRDEPGAPLFLAALFLLGASLVGWSAVSLRRWWLLRRPFVVHAD